MIVTVRSDSLAMRADSEQWLMIIAPVPQAAAGISKVRETIVGMLGDIPHWIATTTSYLTMYHGCGSEEVHKESAKLYVEILEAIELMLQWLKEKPLSTLPSCSPARMWRYKVY